MRSDYRYNDLTKVQLSSVNGCGSSYWGACMFRLPRFLFPGISRACDCHDVGYREAGNEIGEKWALDAQLVEDIREIAGRSGRIMRTVKFKIAALVECALDTWLSEICWRAAKKWKSKRRTTY